ncbi:MAG TPA: sigma 54-interacting transcriptional regulator [Acidobacteriota bacterium]
MRSDRRSELSHQPGAAAVEDQALLSIVEATADKAGEEFFRQLVKHLALALEVDYAFVAEFAGAPTRVRTVALWGPGGPLDNIEYDLDGTPCQEVLNGSRCLHPDRIQELFPKDTVLVTMGARSFFGVPLRAANGDTLGHLAVIDTKPMPRQRRFQEVFELFADRARVELERLRAQAVLERGSRDLEFRLERTAADLQLARDELRALLEVNQAVSRHLRRDELFATLAGCLRDLMPSDRFGIELPVGSDRLRAHVFKPVGAAGAPVHISELPAAGTACRWTEENRQWLVAATRDELRARFPVTYEVMQKEGMQSLCAMPLISGQRSIGVLFFMATRPRAYEQVRRGLLDQVAGAVAVALDNCLAYEELSSLRDRLKRENVYLREEIRQEHNFHEIVGSSPALLKVLSEVETVAPTDSTVVILGETGTGKELIARALHDRSRRRQHPLVKVNCAAISAGLVESELFGHVKGAFTGAVAQRAGRFELADGGTLFLDEIGDLPLETQVKLLRVLQEQEFEPVGSSQSRKVDVRVIAATHHDLSSAVEAGAFRADLFYRLHVMPIRMPALRERREDVPLLVRYFLERKGRELGKRIEAVAPETMKRLMAYDWPGNIRELQNLMERAVILAQGPILELGPELLPVESAPDAGLEPLVPAAAAPALAVSASEAGSLEQVQRRHILAVLEHTGWVIEGNRGAAAQLGLHPNTLRSRMKRLGLQRPAGVAK